MALGNRIDRGHDLGQSLEIPPGQVATGRDIAWTTRGAWHVPSRRLERMAGLSPSAIPAFSVLKVPVRPAPGDLDPAAKTGCRREPPAIERDRGLAQRPRGRRNPIGYFFSVNRHRRRPASLRESKCEPTDSRLMRPQVSSFRLSGCCRDFPPTSAPRATETAMFRGGTLMTARLTFRLKGNGHVND